MDFIIMFFVGMFAMTLGTLAGGGGLITMPALLLLGIPIHSVVGATKISTTVSSISTFVTVLVKKQITLRESFWILPISLTAGFSGGFIANRLAEDTMYTLAIVLLIFALLTSFLSGINFAGKDVLRPTKISVPGLFGIGLYDGMFGPGQGTLLLYLFGYMRVSYIRAIGFVRLATFSSGFGAAINYIAMGKVIWPITISLTAGAIVGAWIGIIIAERINPQYVKPILRIVTIALIVQLILNSFR